MCEGVSLVGVSDNEPTSLIGLAHSQLILAFEVEERGRSYGDVMDSRMVG